MDYDSLRDKMSDGISDAISNLYVLWCEQKGIEPGDPGSEDFYDDEGVKCEIRSALETAISDLD